jgi:3-oxoacyl-[acyl-carrier protein] reductase
LPKSRWDRLDGRTFWITGAGTGYGRAIALSLAAAGATVLLSGRRREKLEESLSHGRSLGIDVSRCQALPVDITDEQSLEQAARAIEGSERSLYGLVNNAALPEPACGPSALASLDTTTWRRLLDTNVTGQWLVCKAALPMLSKGDGWRVVFMTSEAGWACTPGFGPYNVTKAALNGLGYSFAAECEASFPGRDVQVNVLVPGEARTEMNQGSKTSPFAVVPMTLALLSHPRGGPNGKFFHRDGRHLEFAYAPKYSKDLLVDLTAMTEAAPPSAR